MTDEEYLRACGGWTCDYGHTYRTLDKEVPDPWSHERHGSGLTIADAVEVQLAEDRARLEFVLARTPQPEPRSCNPGFFHEVPVALTVTTPEDARRLLGEPMYAPGGAPSNAAAAAVAALKMQRPVVAVKVGEPLTGGPRPSSLSEWAENQGRWVRNWTSMPAGRVAVAVTLDEHTGLWTGNGRAFFVSPGDARDAVDDLLRKQGLL